ncbi:Protein CrtK [Tetrabaena socialis]|uniref:Protein CrtK n=1 Tax=Tetrabaena socialis TaxID=47790 RepID=A0A2J8AAG3_9CHLO|nr:Protein CrtK [Tetrabaena socialis]|eukprot:PNH09508.1 Protein CrtK [Tetrabaena socialis]
MASRGLLELLSGPVAINALGLAASASVVFGVQRLVPTFDPSWYKSLKKPSWTPPNYVFPLVWIPLKLMQTVALWLVATKAPSAAALGVPLFAMGAHMALGNWWNVVFFGQRKLNESLPWMYTFWASVAATAAAFYPISPLAAYLLLPTQVWVTIAAKLNVDIVALNK